MFLRDDVIYQSDEGNLISVSLCVGDTMDPDEYKVPKVLDDWVGSPPNIEKGEPDFDKV